MNIKKIEFLVGEHWALFQNDLTLSTKYIETFRKAQVISKCVNKWARAPEYARKDFLKKKFCIKNSKTPNKNSKFNLKCFEIRVIKHIHAEQN